MVKIIMTLSCIFTVSLVTGKYLLVETEGKDNINGVEPSDLEDMEMEEAGSGNDYFIGTGIGSILGSIITCIVSCNDYPAVAEDVAKQINESWKRKD